MGQRLDKWLVYARFCRHRTAAQDLIERGQVRINGVRAIRSSQLVRPSDVLTMAVGGDVRVVRVLGEAERRGPASAAVLLYEAMNPIEKADASGPCVG